MGAYYSSSVPVKIETKYSRAVSGGTGFAKAAGNYAAALFPAKLGQDQGFTQLIWTDAKEHKYIEESGTMNIIFMVNGKLLSPMSGDTILDGITKRSILDIARSGELKLKNVGFLSSMKSSALLKMEQCKKLLVLELLLPLLQLKFIKWSGLHSSNFRSRKFFL